MQNFTIYLSSIEPSVIEDKKISSNVNEVNGKITIPMLPTTASNSSINIELSLRGSNDNYGLAVFDPGGTYISWERTSNQTISGYDANGNPEYGSSLSSSITIQFKKPGNDRQVVPYYSGTMVSARNPEQISDHMPYILFHSITPGYILGEIPEDKKDIWNKSVVVDTIHVEDQPIVRPGEYLSMTWYLYVNGKNFTTENFICKYETPLFTGGWITGKTGTGKDTKYSVKIFDTEITNIVPTDFYDYEVGKWVYLIKDVNLSEGKQAYGSSDISVPTNSYRIVPFNFKGTMNTECAVPYENAIDLDSEIEFEKVFDMIRYEATISNIDYDNDIATVTGTFGTTNNVPIFYYCDGSSADLVGGSLAFTENDTVIVEVPNASDMNQAKIIGFPNEVKECLPPKFRFIIYREDGIEITTTSGTDHDLDLDYCEFYNKNKEWIQTSWNYSQELFCWEVDIEGIWSTDGSTFTPSTKIDPDGYWITFNCDYGVYIEYPRNFDSSTFNQGARLTVGSYMVSIPIYKKEDFETNTVSVNFSCQNNIPDPTLMTSVNTSTYGISPIFLFNDNYKTWKEESTVICSLPYRVSYITHYNQYAGVLTKIGAGCVDNHIGNVSVSGDKPTVILGDVIPVMETTFIDYLGTYIYHSSEVATTTDTKTLSVSKNISVVIGVYLSSEGTTGKNYGYGCAWQDTLISLELELPSVNGVIPPIIVSYIEKPVIPTRVHKTEYTDNSPSIANKWLSWADSTVNRLSFTARPYIY